MDGAVYERRLDEGHRRQEWVQKSCHYTWYRHVGCNAYSHTTLHYTTLGTDTLSACILTHTTLHYTWYRHVVCMHTHTLRYTTLGTDTLSALRCAFPPLMAVVLPLHSAISSVDGKLYAVGDDRFLKEVLIDALT